MFTDKSQQTEIQYKVHSTSTASPSFDPAVILQDDPTNASSRWTSSTNDQKQYMLLKLNEDCIVTRLTFGKFHKMHVCNPKIMKIYSIQEDGPTPICNSEQRPLLLYKGGLRNDAMPETFALNVVHKNTFIISRYIKIHPTQAWGVNFNFSIWHIKVHGINRRDVLKQCVLYNSEILNRECYKAIYKFLKHQNKIKTLECLESELGRSYEPEIKQNMRSLIENENFEELETLMARALEDGLVNKQRFAKGEWKELTTSKGPCQRGGHAMACHKGILYLQGGWDGHNELCDLWTFNTSTGEWIKDENFNEKRSSHKMTFVSGSEFDSKSENESSDKRNVFLPNDSFLVTGKYVGKEPRDKRAGMFFYDLKECKVKKCDFEWEVQSIHDHQMVKVYNEIYSFGGRAWIENQLDYVEFYVLRNNEFEKIILDVTNSESLTGRVGHSLLYYENIHSVDVNQKIENNEKLWSNVNREILPKKTLIVVGGIRDKQIFKQITFYNLEADTVYRNVDYPFEHDGKIVTRSNIIGDDICVLFCYESGRDGVIDTILFYKYNIIQDKWIKLDCKGKTPVPRAAHTFAYDSSIDRFFLFGGNLGEDDPNTRRLCDLWELRIKEIPNKDLLRKIKFTVRKHVFLRLINKDVNKALEYLQTKVFEVVNHSSDIEEIKFKNLCCEIYKKQVDKSADEIIDDISRYFIDDIRPTGVNICENVF